MSWECPATSRRHTGEQHTRARKRTTSCAKIAFASTGFQTLKNRVGHLTPGTWPASHSPFRRSAPEQDAASPSRCCGECDEIQVVPRHLLQLPFPISSSTSSPSPTHPRFSSLESVQVPRLLLLSPAKRRRDENEDEDTGDNHILEPANISFTRAFCSNYSRHLGFEG
nr:uncharacterized protein LOC117851828 isoform X2 [Setaria viridis]